MVEAVPGAVGEQLRATDPTRRAYGRSRSTNRWALRGRAATFGAVAERRFVELPAGRFSYLEQGTGAPLVLVHALGRAASDWTPVLERLGSRWRCLALDLRGHGQSVRCEDYSFESMEADLRAFVDAMRLDRLTLVGHSMGANVAWLFASRSPDRLDRLVIEDTAPPSPERLVPEPPADPPGPVDFDWSVVGQIIGSLNAADGSWWERLPAITTPTLLISGSSDDELLSLVHEALPAAELVEVEVGHWIHEAAPDEFCDHLERFCGDAGA